MCNCVNNKYSASMSRFNIGLRFYYWEFYRDIEQLPDKEYRDGRIKSHSGYDVCDLYINKKYSSFGEEIKNYKHLDFTEYHQVVMFKAKAYLQTTRCKSTKSKSKQHLHYDIDKGTSLALENVLALILYTDYTILSSDFSSTFRFKYSYETLGRVKTRNRKYWWWSKILRETVELFGEYASGDGPGSNMTGPYYTGLSWEITMPSFSIRLCAPTSTTMQLPVAIKFGGDKGIVLQLNVNGVIDSSLRGFDCRWISRFKEEDERYY